MPEAWSEAWPGIWPWIVVLTGAVATYVWRGMGVALSDRINPEGQLFQWIGAVTYAFLAGLIARLIVLPVGPLEATALTDRLAASVVALAIFLATRRNLLLGVGAGVSVLVLLTVGRVTWL
ncbi:AzlD domain-containing protein [Rhodospirillaceae bacterium SYSU D60014]|uniref:AzlD domain-containing protein n=1 Tax=Virgifigura deserti TaxID=2268457 RepID=UPI000E66E32F